MNKKITYNILNILFINIFLLDNIITNDINYNNSINIQSIDNYFKDYKINRFNNSLFLDNEKLITVNISQTLNNNNINKNITHSETIVYYENDIQCYNECKISLIIALSVLCIIELLFIISSIICFLFYRFSCCICC